MPKQLHGAVVQHAEPPKARRQNGETRQVLAGSRRVEGTSWYWHWLIVTAGFTRSRRIHRRRPTSRRTPTNEVAPPNARGQSARTESYVHMLKNGHGTTTIVSTLFYAWSFLWYNLQRVRSQSAELRRSLRVGRGQDGAPVALDQPSPIVATTPYSRAASEGCLQLQLRCCCSRCYVDWWML